jgi:membrane protease YdiL (CAAX protease family)
LEQTWLSAASAFVDFARRGRTAWWLYPLTLVAALALWIGLVVGVTLAANAAGLAPLALAREMTSPAHPVVFFLGTGATFGSLLLAFAIAARLIQAKRFGEIAGAFHWRLFGAGALAWVVVGSLSALADFALTPSGFSLTASAATLPLAAAAAVGLGLQTLAEEWVFRGWLTQGLLLATRRPWLTALLSGAMFAALHIPNGGPQAASALVFGVVTALIAMRTGGVAFTWGMHLVNNLFGAAVVVSANDVFKGAAGLFTQNTPQLQWVDVAAELVGLGLMLALAWRLAPKPAGGPAEAFE